MLTVLPCESARFNLISYLIADPASGECLAVDPAPGLLRLMQPTWRVTSVVLTHLHYDHLQGLPLFRKGAPVLAHRGERQMFYTAANLGLTALLTRRIPARVHFRLQDGDRLSLGREEITVLHTPGHSPGSLCLYWPGQLISGDTVFVNGVGRSDLPFGSGRALKTSIGMLLHLPPETMIWPGHNYGGAYPVSIEENRRAMVWAMNHL